MSDSSVPIVLPEVIYVGIDADNFPLLPQRRHKSCCTSLCGHRNAKTCIALCLCAIVVVILIIVLAVYGSSQTTSIFITNVSVQNDGLTEFTITINTDIWGTFVTYVTQTILSALTPENSKTLVTSLTEWPRSISEIWFRAYAKSGSGAETYIYCLDITYNHNQTLTLNIKSI